MTGTIRYIRFFNDWRRYRRLRNAEKFELINILPCLLDWTSHTVFDHHYVYLNTWAFTKIVSSNYSYHIDIGSQVGFIAMLSVVVPVVFLDIQSVRLNLPGMQFCNSTILSLPFADATVASISSLHVVEHIGLGRYGDSLDPLGTYKAIRELCRVVAPLGNLYLGLPVGRPRVCFNAHRIHDPVQIVDWVKAAGLLLKSFDGVDDSGDFITNLEPKDFRNQEYACGMYNFTRPS